MSGEAITDYARTPCGTRCLLGSGGDRPGEGNGDAYRRGGVAVNRELRNGVGRFD